MIYISIDTETTGLDTEKHQVLSFAAIIEDTTKKLPFNQLPKFHCIVLWEQITGDPKAILMNTKLIKMIDDYPTWPPSAKEAAKADGLTFCSPEKVMFHFNRFLDENGIFARKFVVAGANFSDFDNIILSSNFPDWKDTCRLRRPIDPSHFFVDWNVDDRLPSLSTCKKRAGFKEPQAHEALLDAYDVIELLRTRY